jgi:hypothetical protein
MNNITTFKIRIDDISLFAIHFEIFAGEKISDTYVNMLASGGYGGNRLVLTPKQFSDFSLRLVAYVYTTKNIFNDEELKTLWNLKLNIFDHEAQQLSSSIFQGKTYQLVKLGLIKNKEDL